MARKKVFQISQDLTQGLEDTINTAHRYSGALNVTVIPLSKIELDNDNPRDLLLTLSDLTNSLSKTDPLFTKKQQELDALQSLAESIKREGILNPILVYKHLDNYQLIAGERRTLASILAGKTDIQAKILEGRPSDYKLSLLQWVENMEREDLTLWERLKNLEKIITHYQQETPSQTHVAPSTLSTIIGCSLPHAMNYCAILEADETIKQLIYNNQIKNLEKAALLARLNQPKIKEQAVEACLKGATLKELKQLAKIEKQMATPMPIIKPMSKVARGRTATRINLGATRNLFAVKFLIESVFASKKYQHLKNNFPEPDWNDYRSVTDIFKKIVIMLEENE